jgi:hypothetical protein
MRELKQLRKSPASGTPLNVALSHTRAWRPVTVLPRIRRWDPSGDVEQLFPFGVYFSIQMEAIMGRGILLWLIGVPIPVIILLALVFHH